MPAAKPTYAFDVDGHTVVVTAEKENVSSQDNEFSWILLMFLLGIVTMAVPTAYVVYLVYTGQYLP